MNLESLQIQVTSGLTAATRQWRRACESKLADHGVSEACTRPLLAISRLGDGVRQVNVAQGCGLESASIVRLIDQLCDAKLVNRGRDGGDRRASLLSLTVTGRTLATAVEAELARLRRHALRGIEASDLEATVRVITALRQVMPE
ncbi:MarR family transcriptional regulator [Pseudomonas sp. ME-P-057]|uniref:MarR family winged helix-turn-helix transcriptional regulator n=1 Tax=Pseudomonas sp. ME-P-057 TaxID=3040321 RepID=UPI0025560AE5|nr:MarR family transcriptional regulator [Pseudomonas sp. ME-P-057]